MKPDDAIVGVTLEMKRSDEVAALATEIYIRYLDRVFRRDGPVNLRGIVDLAIDTAKAFHARLDERMPELRALDQATDEIGQPGG